MDNCRSTDNSVVVGDGVRLYDGLFYSHPAGHCHHRRAGQSHSGTETVLDIRFRTPMEPVWIGPYETFPLARRMARDHSGTLIHRVYQMRDTLATN